MESNPRQALLLTGEMALGGLREATAVGNACEGKPGRHGGRVILLSHTQLGGARTLVSLPTCHYLAAERPKRGWSFKHLKGQAIEKNSSQGGPSSV